MLALRRWQRGRTHSRAFSTAPPSSPPLTLLRAARAGPAALSLTFSSGERAAFPLAWLRASAPAHHDPHGLAVLRAQRPEVLQRLDLLGTIRAGDRRVPFGLEEILDPYPERSGE